MLLSEAGYEQHRHDEGVTAIRSQDLSITDVIDALVKLYADLYEVTAYSINCGMCEDFANDVCDLVAGAELLWGDEAVDADEVEQYAYHCIVRYEGRYYDSQHPWGVDDLRVMSAFHS